MHALLHLQKIVRSVAQPGSVLAWGARGREFKSHRSDQLNQGVVKSNEPAKCWFFLFVPVAVAFKLLTNFIHFLRA